MAFVWSEVSIPSAGGATLHDLQWCESLGLFVGVGTSGLVYTSPDGTTWTKQTAAASNSWNGVAWSPTVGLLVAVSSNGANRVMTSPDGVTWTSRSASDASGWQSVCWADALALYVAVASSGAGHRVMTSADGINWTGQTAASATTWGTVAWSPDLAQLVAVAIGSIMTSADGIAWTSQSMPANTNTGGTTSGTQLCWSSEAGLWAFTAFNTSNSNRGIVTSDDGAAWTFQTIPNAAESLAGICAIDADSEVFLAMRQAGTARVITSEDGVTWTAQDIGFDRFWSLVAWSATLGMVVSWDSGGDSVMLTGISVSLDGIHPSAGTLRGGTVVTITGSGLQHVAQGEVLFDGVAALAVTPADDGLSLTCITAAHAVGPVDVTVTNIGTLTGAYTYVGVTRVTPTSGTAEGGTPVTIRGYGFNATGEVLFTTTPDVANSWEVASNLVVVSNTELTCVTPPHASGVVSVLVQGVGVGTDLYTYTLGQARLPPIPYLVPPVEQIDQKLRGEWVRWLTTVTQRIDTPVTVVPEQIVGGAPLVAVSDTNMRATLTGTPASALLQPVTIALEWQGILGVTRGGTGIGAVSAGALLYGAAAQRWAALSIGAADTFLKSDGSLPAWTAGAALTKTDDANVTLTLGGSAATALVNAASLTLGWTGQLAVGRGGTGLSTIASGGLLYASALDTLSVRSIGNAGDVLAVSGGFPTWKPTSAIAVPYTSISSVPTATVLGRDTVGTGAAEALSTLPSAVQDAITRTGPLDSGSITSGFGSINIGTDALTAGAATFSGILTVTGFGTHDFSGGGAGGNVLVVRNSNSGTGSFARFSFANDLGQRAFFTLLSSGFTPSGSNQPDRLVIAATGSNGLALNASNAAGDVLFYSRNALAMLIGASQTVTLGHTVDLSIGGSSAKLEVVGNTLANAAVSAAMFNATAANGPEFRFYRSKSGTIGTATVVAQDDALGAFTWYGAQQTGTFATQTPAAQIAAFVDATVTSGSGADMPGRIVFSTTPDGSGTLTERMRIAQDGLISYAGYLSGARLAAGTLQAVNASVTLSGASTATGNIIPAGAIVIGVAVTITTAITGASGFQVGDGSDADRWGDKTGTAVGTHTANADATANPSGWFAAASAVTLTAKTSNFTGGVAQVTVYYLSTASA